MFFKFKGPLNSWSSYETLLCEFIYSKVTYFAWILQQSTVAPTFRPHNISHKIFSYPIKIWFLFIDTATNTCHNLTNYVLEQGFIRFLYNTRIRMKHICVVRLANSVLRFLQGRYWCYNLSLQTSFYPPTIWCY